jgi:hypothetical protein
MTECDHNLVMCKDTLSRYLVMCKDKEGTKKISFPCSRRFGGLTYRPSSSMLNLLTMLHPLRPSPT